MEPWWAAATQHVVFGRWTTKGLLDFVARTRALRRFRAEHGRAMLSQGRGRELRGTILLGWTSDLQIAAALSGRRHVADASKKDQLMAVPERSDAFGFFGATGDPVVGYEQGAWGPTASRAVVAGEEGWHDPRPEETTPC